MQIPEHYEFFSQAKIISGSCGLENIPAEFDGFDAGKPLVITGKDIDKGTLKKFIKAFGDSKMTLGGIYDEVREYASIALARDAAYLARERGCDCLIALGNGAIVDVAKAANILLSHKTENLYQFFDGTAVLDKNLKPMIFVPAGCCSGLEATNSVMIDNRRLTSKFLYPDIVIIDARMTAACCSECAARSAVTTVAHALGAAVEIDNSPMAEVYSNAAFRFLPDYMKKSIKSPKNRTAGLAMANASVFSAIAFANSRPGIAHLLSEELAKSTDIAAGTFLRILLPHEMAYLMHKKVKISDEVLLSLGGSDLYASTPAAERSRRGVEVALQYLAEAGKGMPESLKALKVQKYTLAGIAGAAAQNSAKQYSAADCLAVLESAWQGSAS